MSCHHDVRRDEGLSPCGSRERAHTSVITLLLHLHPGYSRLGQAKLQPFRPSNMTVITGYSRLGQAKLQPFRPSTTKIFRFSGYSTINDFQQVSTKIQSKLKLSSDAVEAKYYNHAIFGTKLVTPPRSSTIAF